MNRKIKILTVLVCGLLFFAGCTTQQEQNTDSDGDNKINVYTSFYPMYDFVSKVGGDKVQVTNLLPFGEEVHHWEPTPVDMVNISKADLFVYSGLGMEHWIEPVLESLGDQSTVVVLEASKGTYQIESQIEADIHTEGRDEHTVDPHVWLSLANGKEQMKNIKDALVQIDPENQTYYENNFETYAKQFDDLNAEFSTKLANAKSKDVVVSHQAFAYLCDAYGLQQKGIEGIIPHSEPDPATMASIIEYIKANNVHVIFFESHASSKVMETIAKETGASIEQLNTLESLSDEQLAAGEDYFSMMKKNLDALVKGLQ